MLLPNCLSPSAQEIRSVGWTVLAMGIGGGVAGPAGEPFLSGGITALVLGSVATPQEGARPRRLVKLAGRQA